MTTEVDLEENEQKEPLTLLTHRSTIPCMLLLLLPQPASDWPEARKRNIAEMRRLNVEASRLDAKADTQQEQSKASRPRPRRVLLQPKDLGASELGQKTTVSY
jgi:hypothetical protein